jgi:hypothetical protein
MNIFTVIVAVLGAVVLLIVGLVNVLYDLLARGPHGGPVMTDESTPWPYDYPKNAAVAQPGAADRRHLSGYARSPWSTDRENT